MIIYSFCENRISRGQDNIFRIGFRPMSLAVRCFFYFCAFQFFKKAFLALYFFPLRNWTELKNTVLRKKRHAARPAPPHRPRHMNYWLYSVVPLAYCTLQYILRTPRRRSVCEKKRKGQGQLGRLKRREATSLHISPYLSTYGTREQERFFMWLGTLCRHDE